LRAEVIQLLLLASEIRWRGKPEQQGKMPLEKLAEEAEAAALHTGDLALIARVKFLRGQVILVIKNFPEALKAMQDALEIAQKAGDPLIEFIIMSRLGHETASQNLATALAMMSQAYDLYESRLRTSPPPGIKPAMLAQAFHRLQSLIGVGKFDQGNYGEAIQWLTSSVAGLKQLKMRDYLLAPYNFLAQVYIASGLFEDAEAVLIEVLELFKDEKELNAWNAYNQALLGKLYLEWNRVEDAAGPLIRGWEQTQATWYVAMVPLVRNYYAELLMHPDYSGRNWGEAERLLIETVNESKQTGAHRSAIAALSLLSQLFLLQGRVEGAVDYSTQALEYLKKMGMAMPALRTEEVLLNHFRTLKAAGREGEARNFLERANEVIQQKASLLRDEEQRRSFLERIAINRAILSAMN
jgi:tetratricopeptide (TPR) repeat protein